MAEDARISCALPFHPKMRKLYRRHGAEGCWSWVCVILWVAVERPDGNLHGLSDEDIELAAQWEGAPGALVATLGELRFLDGDTGSYRIHDWADHQPWVATKNGRIEKARKAAAARWRGGADAPSIIEHCYEKAEHDLAMPTTQPNLHPTQPTPHLPKPTQSTPPKANPTSEAFGSDQASKPAPEKRKAEPPAEAWDLARLLQGEILGHKPDAQITEGQLRSWAATADLMLRLDHRSPERVAAVIQWAQADSFWQPNVLSMATVRKKFDALELRARQKGATPPNGRITPERVEQELEAARRLAATGTAH